MNKPVLRLSALLLLISGCSKPQPPAPERQEQAPSATVQPASPTPPVPERHTPTARQPTLDPKSSEAAEELVRGFAQLLNAGRTNDAYMLLGANAPDRQSFDTNFRDLGDIHAEVGRAGDQDGAAGSIYLSVPLTITGTANGQRVQRSATAVVRRVNDVPGSTEAQRHWHIERVDWDR